MFHLPRIRSPLCGHSTTASSAKISPAASSSLPAVAKCSTISCRARYSSIAFSADAAVLVVATAVTEHPADWRQEHRERVQRTLLAPRKLHLAVVGPREDHHLQSVRQSLLVDLSVASQAEVGLEERLGIEGRPKLDERRDLAIARVPPDVRRTRRNDHDLAGLVLPFLAADTEYRRPAADLKALLLRRVHVRCGDEAGWPQVQVHLHQLPTGVAGALAEDDSLAGHRMYQRVLLGPERSRSCRSQLFLLLWLWWLARSLLDEMARPVAVEAFAARVGLQCVGVKEHENERATADRSVRLERRLARPVGNGWGVERRTHVENQPVLPICSIVAQLCARIVLLLEI